MEIANRLLEHDSVSGRRKLNVLQLAAGVRLLEAGVITRTQFNSVFDLDADERTFITNLITKYQAAVDKAAFLQRFVDLGILAERKMFILDAAQLKTSLDNL